MQILEAAQNQQCSAYIQSIMELANQVAEASPDMREPVRSASALPIRSPAVPPTERERMVQALAKEHRGKSRVELQGVLGKALGAEVADAMQSQAPTAREAFTKYQQQEREAKRELGKGLAAAGVEVRHHSVKDYTHVIVTQLDLLQDGAIPSVSTVVNAAFPDDPKKATSIKNSQHGKRRRQAWDSPAVVNHPMEKTMQATHGRNCMNRRHSARTFGQSLSMNATLFMSSDRITKLEARVQLLEQQMRETKARESLSDAGCTSSRDKVLALYSQEKRPAVIARELGMNRDTVKSIIRRSKVG